MATEATVRPSAVGWGLPESPWVLHATRKLAPRPFVELQTRAQGRFESRLLGIRVVGGAPRNAHWLVASDRLDHYLAYRGVFATGGLSAVWLAHRFRENPPAVVHGHFGPIAAQLRHLARALGAPLVGSFYGYDASLATYVESRLWRARYQRLFRDAACFLAEGPAMAARLVALGCSGDKLRIVRLPADEERLARCRPLQPEGFVVSAAGRFVEKKGFDTAIRAFARALRGRRDARLRLTGGGELESALRRLAVDEGVSDQVDWCSALPFEEFMTVAAGASVAVFPSRRAANGDSEGGAPLTLVELQWLGVPALVSDHDDLPFAAAPGTPVIPATDVDAWADVLTELYRSQGQLVPLGEAAKRFARAHHSVAGNVAAREGIYTSLLG